MHTFKVENMSCGGCAARITRAIQVVDPDAKVEVALRERLVRVGSGRAAQAVADAITTAGFSARQVTQA